VTETWGYRCQEKEGQKKRGHDTWKGRGRVYGGDLARKEDVMAKGE
jgi:hypothetical protein